MRAGRRVACYSRLPLLQDAFLLNHAAAVGCSVTRKAVQQQFPQFAFFGIQVVRGHRLAVGFE
jgi:hypothetical protein